MLTGKALVKTWKMVYAQNFRKPFSKIEHASSLSHTSQAHPPLSRTQIKHPTPSPSHLVSLAHTSHPPPSLSHNTPSPLYDFSQLRGSFSWHRHHGTLLPCRSTRFKRTHHQYTQFGRNHRDSLSLLWMRRSSLIYQNFFFFFY